MFSTELKFYCNLFATNLLPGKETKRSNGKQGGNQEFEHIKKFLVYSNCWPAGIGLFSTPTNRVSCSISF